MDKNAIKKYAVWARRELIERIAKKALQYGIEEKNVLDVNADSIGGKLLSASEKKQRQALIAQIKDKGYEQVMEEVAYTWFNRFSALRFMEVNGYLPTHVRVFTDEANNFKPQILAEAIHLEMDGLDMDKVFELKDANQTDELYKYLLITQCNSLNKILPVMFQKISDYTELLLPDNLLREGSVIEQMITLIEEENWKDAVQIIGWLYQYYNSEKKDEVFAALKKNVKITKENIPAATQLFTPDWIVRYMVENSLGRLWLEGHQNDGLKSNWKYYLDEAEQEADVQAQIDKIRDEYKNIKPEEIKCIDPCTGSGHILAYMFDVLVQIYEAYGYTAREAANSIVENNIYGLDIDERAAQLAYFAVMMKARQYDRRFFLHGIQPHLHAIQESNAIDDHTVEYFCNGDSKLEETIHIILHEMFDAKEYGSILRNTPIDFSHIYVRFEEIREDINICRETALNELLPLVQVTEVMVQKYDVVVTNPPYMGNSGMSVKLGNYVKKYYPDSKSDMFAVFLEHCGQMTKTNGYQAMITQHAWMSLASYEKLRYKIYNKSIVNMVHLGAKAFEEISGEMVQTTSFVIQHSNIMKRKGLYCRLVEPTTAQGKEELFNSGENRYVARQDRFERIPGAPVTAYVAGDTLSLIYEKGKTINDIGDVKIGMGTGNNDLFLRLWWEVKNNTIDYSLSDISQIESTNKKYFPYSKGGERKRWYGNHEYVVWFDNDGQKEMARISGHRENGGYDYYFHKGVTWSYSTMSAFSARIMPDGFVFDVNGSSLFLPEEYFYFTLALLQSCVGRFVIDSTKSAFSIQAGTIRNLPIIGCTTPVIEELTDSCISLSRDDWDSFETSWDFVRHPLIRLKDDLRNELAVEAAMQNYYGVNSPTAKSPLELCHLLWQGEANERFNKIKTNEEELNCIFIDIYGLRTELIPEVDDNDMTVRKADLQRDIKGLISYAVGCMFGRYSLDVDGLIYAGGEWDATKYRSFAADKDNIIPICDDEYFDDDIVGRFVKFIEVVYGIGTLQENLKFIADALGGKGNPKEIIRNYFLNDFYNDHVKMYQKRPIYWQFDSGKKNGFKCLIYMHRYQPDTIMRIRTDYVHEQQSRYRTAISDLEQRINGASTSERVKLTKKLTALQAQAIEIREYEEKIHHIADQMIRIDLDDGVKSNYEIFKDVLAKIK